MSMLDILLVAIIVTVLIIWIIQQVTNVKRLAVTKERLEQQLEITEQLQQVNKTLQAEKENLIRQTTAAQGELQFLNDQYNLSKRYQKENEILISQLSMFKAKFQAAEEKFENQKKEVEQIGEHFALSFKNIAQTVFEEKFEKFIQLNEDKINYTLTVFKTQLADLKQKVEETCDKESKNAFPLATKCSS